MDSYFLFSFISFFYVTLSFLAIINLFSDFLFLNEDFYSIILTSLFIHIEHSDF